MQRLVKLEGFGNVQMAEAYVPVPRSANEVWEAQCRYVGFAGSRGGPFKKWCWNPSRRGVIMREKGYGQTEAIRLMEGS